MNRHVGILLLSAGLLGAPSVAALGAESPAFDWGFGPTFVPADDFEDHFGARVYVRWRDEKHVAGKNGPWSRVLGVDGQYLWVNRSVQIPDATEARVIGLLSWSPGKSEKRKPADVDPDELIEGGSLNPGFLEFGGTAAYERSPDRREQHVTAGGEVRYGNNSPTTLGMLIPSIVVLWEWVEPIASAARDAASIGDDGDDHTRWSVRGYINARGGYISTRLDSWQLQLDGSVFRASGLEQALEDAGWSSGEYFSATLRFSRRFKIVGPLALTSIYAGFATGQLPTDFKGRDALTGGVSLTFAKGSN